MLNRIVNSSLDNRWLVLAALAALLLGGGDGAFPIRQLMHSRT